MRKIVEKVQDFIDKAIDGLINKVIGLFTGKGKGGAAPPSAAADAAAGADGVEPETVKIAGEDHTLRAVGPDGEATVEMASGPFGNLVSRMNKLIKQLKKTYTTPGAEKYLGDAKAAKVNEGLDALGLKAQEVVNAVAAAKTRSTEGKAVKKGFNELRTLINALGLEGATTTVLHARHGVKAGPVISYGRQTWFEVFPLCADSKTRGQKAAGPTPGVKVLPNYDQGHLAAKSLGGPGTADNLVPMSSGTNREKVGVVGMEDALRYAIGKFAIDHPQASPGYLFRYRVTANYRASGGLQDELKSHGVDRPDSEPELFKLAEAATKNPPSNDDLRALVNVPADPRANSLLAENLRRRLVYWFAPMSITPKRDLVVWPETHKLELYAEATVPNHLGQDLNWVD